MSTYEKYVGSAMGRTFLLSGILSIILAYVTFIIPLAPADDTAWYSFLFKDVTLDPAERFSWTLVLLESFLFGLFYFFFALTLASYTELQNQIPTWTQLIYSGLLTLVMAWIVPKISVGDATIGEIAGSGFNHFTESMQSWVMFFTIIFIILWTLYYYYTDDTEV